MHKDYSEINRKRSAVVVHFLDLQCAYLIRLLLVFINCMQALGFNFGAGTRSVQAAVKFGFGFKLTVISDYMGTTSLKICD